MSRRKYVIYSRNTLRLKLQNLLTNQIFLLIYDREEKKDLYLIYKLLLEYGTRKVSFPH